MLITFTVFSLISVYLVTKHSNLFRSLLCQKQVAYGVYSTLYELIFYHFWFLFKCKLFGGNRDALLREIEDKFRSAINTNDVDINNRKGNVIVTHSCRTIFYCIIKLLLSEKKKQGKSGPLRICCCSMQFGSFYRLLRAIELAEDTKIEFYEIDLTLNDWTLNTAQINEEEVSKCDLILCMHLFGVPFDQDPLFQIGHKLNIPILEDCVQSGSLFGGYKGHKLSDVRIWSGGFDKTPSCFGGGFGYFCDTKYGNSLYQSVQKMHDSFDVDTFKDRFNGLLNQSIHLLITRNHFWFNCVVGCIFYFVYYKPNIIKWYEISLKFRKNKTITPFQHQSTVFLSKPSLAQLHSLRYGISKDYDVIIAEEIRRRDLFLSKIPKQYHAILFPFLTDKVQARLRENRGISEFTWVYSKEDNRTELSDHLAKDMITMINTTWVYHEHSKLNPNNSKFICDNMSYLPNLNEMTDREIVRVAKALTDFCVYKKY